MKKTIEKSRNYVNILGINVISTSRSLLLADIERFISHNKKFYIVTPNPELVLMSQSDDMLRKALNSSEMSVPDGIGLVMAYKFIFLPAPKNFLLRFFVALFQGLYVGLSVFVDKRWLTSRMETIKGRELFLDLMKLADKNSWKVFFLGGEHGEAEIAAQKMISRYKNVKIESEPGPMFDNEGDPATSKDKEIFKAVARKINDFRPQLLIVCLSDPKEEKFVYKNFRRLNIVGAGAFGGTFRYIAGMSKLPPKWMEKAGLEWVYRLITEPYRIRRIFNAFPVFPLKVFLWKFSREKAH